MQKKSIPGVSIGITLNDQEFYSQGYGYRDIDHFKSMSEKTLLGIGSLSKAFTVLGILKLYSEGKLELTDPVNKYLDYKLGSDDKPITIHHLLSHSSGVPELDGANYVLDRIAGSTSKLIPMVKKEEFLYYVNKAKEEQIFPPSEHYFYNNDHFTCLGLIIEKLSNKPFNEYISENFLKPLDMTRTVYTPKEFANDPENNFSTFYIKDPKSSTPEAKSFPFSHLQYPPGGVISCSQDMIKYMQFLLNKGKKNDLELLPSNLIDKMFTPVVKMPHSINNAYYCYGFVNVDDLLPCPVLEHGGNIIVSSAYIILVPEHSLGIFVGANIGDGFTSTIAYSILGQILKEDNKVFFPFAERYKVLKELCGEYKTYQGLNQMIVKLDNGTLFAEIKNDVGSQIYPLILKDEKKLEFQIAYTLPISNMVIEFVKTEEGTKAIFERYVFHKVN